MLEPGARVECCAASAVRRSRSVPSVDAEIARRPAAPGRRRRQPHHRRHDHDLDEHRHEALPEKDRVREADDAAGHDAAVRDDVADRRLQRARRRHLQRRRSAQALRPDAAEAQKARGRERAIVDVLHAARDLDREHRAEDQAESPVEPRAGQREERDERDRAARRASATPRPRESGGPSAARSRARGR